MKQHNGIARTIQSLLPPKAMLALPMGIMLSSAQAMESEVIRNHELTPDTLYAEFNMSQPTVELSRSQFRPNECDEDTEDCDADDEEEGDESDCDGEEDCDADDEEEGDEPECDGEEDCDADDEEEGDEPECDGEEDCDADDEEEGDEPECDGEEDCDADDEEEGDEPECDGEQDCDADDEEEGDEPECDSEEDCDADDEGEEQRDFVTTGFINPNPEPNMTIEDVDIDSANKAARFLHQATLGANYPTITQVAAMGEEQWLEQQFQQPIGYLFPQTEFLLTAMEQKGEEFELFGSPVKFHMHAWLTQAMTSPDLVRQRIAVALSEIFVISSNVETLGESPFAISNYYDVLLKHSFGNFRDLLLDISLNPAMAVYLSHLNNEKANPELGTFPDENYAREVMQLFSIGLFELNPDGSRKKDAQGRDIPTYGQNEIREFAKVFTGLAIENEEGFGFGVCCNDQFYTHAAKLSPLVMYDDFHSSGEKTLLNGKVLAAGQTGMQDVEAAIDNLFNHPNVGPFIGKQLIQRLVKSNPSPAYITRVTAAFNGETGSPRGDMKTLIKAILLDPEARELNDDLNNEGRLREPFLRLLRLSRMFNATTTDRNYAVEGFDVREQIQQYVFYAPSVFNFFQPNYSPNGEVKDQGLVAPEFQITNAVTIIEIKNLVQKWLMTGRFDEPVGLLQPETLDFAYQLSLAEQPEVLINHLDTVMTYGTLSSNTKDVIRQVLENENNTMARVKKAIYLIATSPDYAIAL